MEKTPQEIRAEIEARRGIVRDEAGRIIRTKEWRKERIKFLKAKIVDFAQRTENAKVEIEEHEKALKTK